MNKLNTGSHNKTSKIKQKEILDYYKEGLLIKEISMKTKISRNTVGKILREKGITIRELKKRIKRNVCKKCGWFTKEGHLCPKNNTKKGLTKETSEIIRVAEEKRINTWRELYNQGKIKIWNKGKKGLSSWNKGLTKEKDHRLKNLSEIIKKTHWSKKSNKEKVIKKVVETKKRLFKEGKINPTIRKGQTLIERYGEIRAKEILSKQRKTKEKNGTLPILDKNPAWLGGKSFEPYGIEFNREFRNLIRKRDNQICSLCQIHKETLRTALSVHHINYDKTLNISQNCISLCNRCHTITNYNREHWTKFFQELLSEKYGYKYNEQGEVILPIIS